MPKIVPDYGKVLTLGARFTNDIFNGPVQIQEKLDGSCMGLGINEKGELVFRSRGVNNIFLGQNKMFDSGIEYLLSIEKDILREFGPDTYFYVEYFSKPKHNTLAYGRIPKNHFMLFDVFVNSDFVSDHKTLSMYADMLGIEAVPLIFQGEINPSKEDLAMLVNVESVLGMEKREGIVIKNYQQSFQVGPVLMPLFVKYVREDFKERNDKTHTGEKPKDKLQALFQTYESNEPRWRKAVQYLRDSGELEESPRDIPKIIHRVHEDLEEEEADHIKDQLYKIHVGPIKGVAIKRLAEWYKELLLESVVC